MEHAQSFEWKWLLLLLLIALIWFGGLGYRPLAEPDEGRYAEIPREMVASGDFVTPRLNGIKYFEKPPLQYWMTAASYKVFGVSEWSARLWPALTGFLGGLVVWFFTRRWMGEKAAATAVFEVGRYDQGLPFYLGKTVALAAVAGELKFGIKQEPYRTYATPEALEQAWKAAPLAIAVMHPDSYDKLVANGFLVDILTRDAKRVIVVKPK